ncbi:KTSC domain-containing protein [Neorhizobium alkalisoli]|uniref:KTSC domain-containing protein n=1 Tax=Neorhizobium alkalisoli TaxID=528178 RepID=UPI000CF8899F|nr:KTSC domain-containing protein [Neorhizobium alkalisoli]
MRVELRSKLIDAASYEEDKRLLRIYMANGQLREFVDVPRQVFNDLAQAVSAGTYYVQNIKGRFPGAQ